jgi:hypothetical protein
MADADESTTTWPPERLYISAARRLLSTFRAPQSLQKALDDFARQQQLDDALALAPAYLSFPDADTAAVPAGLVQALWPSLRARAEQALASAFVSGAEGSSSLLPRGVRLEAVSLGAEPPRLASLHASPLGLAPPEDAAMVDTQICWAGGGGGGGEEEEEEDAFRAAVSIDPAEVRLQPSSPSSSSRLFSSFFLAPVRAAARLFLLLPLGQRRLLISLSEPQLLLRARLTLRPVTSDPPYIGSVALTLLAPPHVDGALCVALVAPFASSSSTSPPPRSLDLFALPVFGAVARAVARRLLTSRLGFPRCMVIELTPGGSKAPSPAGVLRLRILRAEGLKRPDGSLGPAALRPFVVVEVREGRAQRTAACSNHRRTNHPTWGGGGGEGGGGNEKEPEGEPLDFVVDDLRRQRLVLAVCEDEGGGGPAALPSALSRALGLGGGDGGLLGPEAAGAHVLGAAVVAPLADALFVRDLPGERVPLALVLRPPLRALVPPTAEKGEEEEEAAPPASAAATEAEATAAAAPTTITTTTTAASAAAAASEAPQRRGTLYLEAQWLPFEEEKQYPSQQEQQKLRRWAGGAPALTRAAVAASAAAPVDPRTRGFLTVDVDRVDELSFGGGGGDAGVVVELRVGDPFPCDDDEAEAGGEGASGAQQRQRRRNLVQRTSVARGEPSPRWSGEKRDFALVSAASVLVATVLDVSKKGVRVLGRARTPVAEAVAAGGRWRRRLPLSGALTGYVELSLEWTPAARLVAVHSKRG